jgi:D-alanine--poly(phosphoribitol) ligase subunit 2
MNKDQAVQLILEVLGQFNQIHRNDRPVPVGPNTQLFGSGGNLDSLDLVRFLLLVEEAVQQTGRTVALTDEKAMSQRTSPFASVNSLAEYLAQSALQPA